MTLDGSASKGDGPLVCTWSFEDQAGSTVYETLTGCKLSKTFQTTGTKYVKLTVRDADGDTNSNKQSFNVARRARPRTSPPRRSGRRPPPPASAGS